jgi:transposase-like protein
LIHERRKERLDYANGYKPKQFNTRMGQIDVNIPQVRGGGFYSQSVEKGVHPHNWSFWP